MKKKILHVIERFNVAGAEIVVRDLLITSDPDKWDMEVCVLHDIGVIGNELFDKGYPIHYLNWERENLTDTTIIKRLKTLIKERGIDIVHAHNITPWYFSFRALRGCKKKLSVTIHGFVRGKGSFKKKILYVFLSYFTHKIIVVSESIKKNIATFPFIKLKETENIINGIKLINNHGINREKIRKEIGLSNNDFVIGTVGRLFREKNIELQLEMIGRLVEKIPNIKLVIVSKKYDYIKKLEAIIQRLNIENHVVFTGLRRDIPRILSTFDVFVMSSFSEGTSIALLEAMSSGLPVVVSDVGGNSDIVKDKENGLLFKVHDLNLFCEHIQNLYHDANYRSMLADKAELSCQKYSIEKMVQKYEKIYKNLLG